MENEKMVWEAFGDVNPFEHGGGWARKLGDSELEIILLEESDHEDFCKVSVLEINLKDTWIKEAEVASTCDWNLETSLVQRAVDCVWYYGTANFGANTYRMDIETEAKVLVRSHGIDV